MDCERYHPSKRYRQPSITLAIKINLYLRLPTKPSGQCGSQIVNGYPDQNNHNHDRHKQSLEKILKQGGNKLFGQEWPKGDIANDKRDWKSQIENG